MINKHLLGLEIKSPIHLTERDMNVEIAICYGKENELNNSSASTTNLNNYAKNNSKNLTLKKENDKNIEKDMQKNSKFVSLGNDWKKKKFCQIDVKYDILMNEIGRIKNNIQQDVNFFK